MFLHHAEQGGKTDAVVPACRTTNPSAPHLELRFSPGALVRGVPESFTFEIVNVSRHNIRIPKPIVDCAGQYTGFIWLRVLFKPSGSTTGVEPGFGCAADKVNWPPILQRAQAWRLLHPGESVSQTVAKEKLHYEGREAGIYEFWAVYTPPALDSRDEKTLRKAGIDFPSTPLSTRHLFFTGKPRANSWSLP